MRIQLALLMGFAALPLVAGNIDVSGQTTVFLNTGDVLYFAVPDWNFVADANILGVSQYPDAIGFQFLTAPTSGATQFAVSLESADGSASVAYPGLLSLVSGTLESSLYSGPVLALSGTLNIPASESAQIFDGAAAILEVSNTGAPVTLGIAPYTFQQDMYVSLEGSSFSVGAPQASVVLDPPDVPESRTVWLLATGLIGIGAIVALRKRAA